MRVSFGLPTDPQDGRACPWDVVAVVLQVVGGSKHPPQGRNVPDEVLVLALEFGRSRDMVQQGTGMDRQAIVARMVGEESHP